MAGVSDSDRFKSVWHPLSGVFLKHAGGGGEPSAFLGFLLPRAPKNKDKRKWMAGKFPAAEEN